MTQELKVSIRRSIMGKRKQEEIPSSDTIWISTGSDVMDMGVGGGIGIGYPAGKIINIVGDKSSGKTFLATELIASAYHRYKNKLKWVYDDCESGFTFDTKKLYGFEIMPMNEEERFKSRTVQELYGNLRMFLNSIKKDEFGIYIVDSLDGLSSDELEELSDKRFKAFKEGKDFDKGSYRMESAKFLSQEFFKTLADDIHDKNVLLVFISQIRYNIDPMSFEKWTRAGGKALDFYAYAVVWLATLTKIEKKDRAIGVVVKAKTTKLKAPRPFREWTFSLIFDYGLDNTGSNIDYLYDLRGKRGELLKDAKAIQWDELEPMTRDELVQYIEDNKLQKELRNRVIEKWEAVETSIQTTRKNKYDVE